jgi:formate/nitrite transporter FocA (FNT family)
MHDEPLTPYNLSQSATEHLDQRIVRALETAPEIQIPADFAARVASQIPATRPVSLTPTHYGQNAMLAGMVVTLATLLVLALNSAGHATFGLLESLLSAQFIALAVWLSVWRHSLR